MRAGPKRSALARAIAFEKALIDEMRFLAAWEAGRYSGLIAFLRVRQIRRANLLFPTGRTAAGD
jgi:hypothetical protein